MAIIVDSLTTDKTTEALLCNIFLVLVDPS